MQLSLTMPIDSNEKIELPKNKDIVKTFPMSSKPPVITAASWVLNLYTSSYNMMISPIKTDRLARILRGERTFRFLIHDKRITRGMKTAMAALLGMLKENASCKIYRMQTKM